MSQNPPPESPTPKEQAVKMAQNPPSNSPSSPPSNEPLTSSSSDGSKDLNRTTKNNKTCNKCGTINRRKETIYYCWQCGSSL